MKLRITVEGKVYEVGVEIVGDQAPARPAAPPATDVPPPPRPSPAPAAASPAAAPVAAGAKTYPSPLAGTVTAISVKPGDTVQADQEVMMLEAMKMETSIYAACAGTVKAVLVDLGVAVTSGQPLIEFE